MMISGSLKIHFQINIIGNILTTEIFDILVSYKEDCFLGKV